MRRVAAGCYPVAVSRVGGDPDPCSFFPTQEISMLVEAKTLLAKLESKTKTPLVDHQLREAVVALVQLNKLLVDEIEKLQTRVAAAERDIPRVYGGS